MEDEKEQSSYPCKCSLEDLFNIDLVMEKIFFYLDLQELKFLGEISKAALRAVRKSKEYSNKATLIIGKDAVENDFNSVKALCSGPFMWEVKNLRIDAAISIEALQILETDKLMMNNVESIKFCLSDIAKSDSDVVNFLIYVLEKAESFHDLELEPPILTKGIQDIICNESVWSNLENLRSLEIQSFQTPPVGFTFKNFDQVKQMGMAIDALGEITLGLKHMKKLAVSLGWWLICKNIVILHYFDGIVWILDNIKETLEELVLIGGIWELEEIGNIHIPKLKRLTISTPELGTDTVKKFLANQGQIDHLDIEIPDMFIIDAMRLIKEKQSGLKFLRIKVQITCNEPSNVDWNSESSVLYWEYWRFHMGYCGYGENILHCIPATVEAVGLNDFGYFWSPYTQLQERNIWQRLSHLINLTELDLDGSEDALNDNGLQDLIWNCPNLKGLAFSHCPDVTSFGVTGVDLNGERAGVSIDVLTGLKSLSIRSCSGIDKDKLFSVVVFRFLKSFSYDAVIERRSRDAKRPQLTLIDYLQWPSNYYWTGQDEIIQLRSQNPCLQELSLFLPFPDGIHWAEVKQERGRLTIIKHDLGEERKQPICDDDLSDCASRECPCYYGYWCVLSDDGGRDYDYRIDYWERRMPY